MVGINKQWEEELFLNWIERVDIVRYQMLKVLEQETQDMTNHEAIYSGDHCCRTFS